MHEICANTFFKGKFMCTPSFLVCAHLTTCARAHSLEGTLPATWLFQALQKPKDYDKWVGR